LRNGGWSRRAPAAGAPGPIPLLAAENSGVKPEAADRVGRKERKFKGLQFISLPGGTAENSIQTAELIPLIRSFTGEQPLGSQ
jgi:hypothetical protein